MARTRHATTPKSKKTSCFQSSEAKNRFTTVVSTKSVIPDKGFHNDWLAPTSGCDFVNLAITALGWTNFCAPRDPPDMDLVKELYANLWNNATTSVYVHDRMVRLTGKAINDLFSLSTPSHDGYAEALPNPNEPMFQQVLQTVVVDGTQRTVSRQQLRSCKRQDLRPTTKM